MTVTLFKAQTRETRPDQNTGFFNVPCKPCNTEDAGDEPTISSPYPKRLERLTICIIRGSKFCLVFLKTLSVGPVWGSNP